MTKEKQELIFDYAKKQLNVLFLSTIFSFLCVGSFGAYIGYITSFETFIKFGFIQLIFVYLYDITHSYFFDDMQEEVNQLYDKVKDDLD